MSTLPETVARWDKFLAGIHERFGAVLSEAQAGCAQLLADNDYDTNAFGIAWSAMEARAKQLDSKLWNSWEDKVSPMFDALDLEAAVEDRERHKAETLSGRMEVELEQMRVRVFADAARAVWQRAVAQAPPQLSCSGCGAPMAVPQALSAVNLTCPHCSAVVTYEPGMRLRAIEHFCVHPLCEELSWQQWLAQHEAERALNDSRNETIALLQAYEHAQLQYWRTYLTHRVQLLPARAADFDKDLRGRMAAWYDRVHHSAAWIKAGRPRTLA